MLDSTSPHSAIFLGNEGVHSSGSVVPTAYFRRIDLHAKTCASECLTQSFQTRMDGRRNGVL